MLCAEFFKGQTMAYYDDKQIARISHLIRKTPTQYRGLDFYTLPDKNGDRVPAPHLFPDLNHPNAIDFFFFSCSQNYGFWYGNAEGYESAIRGRVGNRALKGSDLMSAMFMNVFRHHPYRFAPKGLALCSAADFMHFFSDDRGIVPFPDFEERYKIASAYARWFMNRGYSPAYIVERANSNSEPLKTLLSLTRDIPGYDRDPLLKKNFLLAMALAQRPERFLKVTDPYHWCPIVDYHLMRVALRLGIVKVDFNEAEILEGRAWCNGALEHNVRCATYQVVQSIMRQTKKSMFEIDELLWSARRYCPEETTPECEKCFFNSACAKRTNLFQPVIRTTNY
jgi:hypothetical protein